MTSCTWMIVRGCLRCIDGVSPNLHRDDCRASGAGASSVEQMLAALPPGPVGPAGGGLSMPYVIPNAAWLGGGLGGFGGGRALYHDAHTGEWLDDGDEAPDLVLPSVSSPLPVVEVPAATLPLEGGTLQPSQPEVPSAVPEPAGILLFAAALLVLAGLVLLRKTDP